jgi:GNAT superfamily N-acetyltransferase
MASTRIVRQIERMIPENVVGADSDPVVRVEQESAELLRGIVLEGLRAYNRTYTDAAISVPLAVAARAGDTIIGGLVGETHWQWLHVELLWVAESYRGRGLGRRLLRAAEDEARLRGVRHAYLDTLDFQARPFYEREGWVVFGVLEDYPPGYKRFYMRKDLIVVR